MANGDKTDNLDLLIQSIGQTYQGEATGLDYDPRNVDYYGLIDYTGDDVAQELHRAQSGMRQLGAGLAQTVGEVVGGTIEGIGYLADARDTYDALATGQVEVGNFISEFGKSIKEGSRELTPIYTDPFKEGEFSPEDWSWWMSNMPSIASTLSLMIPSGVATKSISGAAKAIGLGSKLSKTGKVIAKGVTQATISRQMEAFMEAASAQDETYNSLIQGGASEEIAKQEASRAAADTYKTNWAMLAQDILQYTTLAKPFGKATTDLSIKTAKRLGKDITPVIANKFAAVGRDMVGEAAEEGYQYIVGERAREMAEYRAGLRSKRSLGAAMGDYMGEGDFWSGAFFGALGAGVMQTAGRGLNMARERVRDLEDEDTRRIRDIDSWTQSIRGLGNLDTTGEVMGTPTFNSKNRQLAEFGTRLAQNGNLDWFLEVSDNFQNMSPEDQETFGFTPEDLEASKKQFPALKQDIKKIGDIYDNVVNTAEISPIAVDMLVQEQFIADKTLEQYNKENGNYSSSVNNITGLSDLNVPPSTRDLVIKEKIELNNLVDVRKDLKKQNASEEVISEYDTRIKNLREEIKEDKKNLSTFAEHKYKTFNTRADDFRTASSSYLKKEFLSAEHKSAMEQVDYYSDPKNTEEINKNFETTQVENIKQASEEAITAQEVENIQEETEEFIPTGTTVDLTNFNKKKADEQAEATTLTLDVQDKKEYDNISDAIRNKYEGNPHLLNRDITKILDYIQPKNLSKDFTDKEIEDLRYAISTININLKKSRDLDPLENTLLTLSVAEGVVKKLYNKLFDIINADAKKADILKSVNNTEDSLDSSVSNSTGTDEEKTGVSIHLMDVKTGRRIIKDNSQGSNFKAVNYIEGKGPKELGIDQEALNKGKVKIGDTVTFRIDKEDSYEKTSRKNKDVRGFDMVVNDIVIGKVPKVKSEPSVAALREVLQQQIEANYDKSARYVKAEITTTVAGSFYNYTRTKDLGTPNRKITKEDQQQSNIRRVGGWAMDFIETKGDKYYLSGKTGLENIGIEVEDQFPQRGETSINGALMVLVPHPIMEGQHLYLRAFLNTLKQVETSNNTLYNSIKGDLVNLFSEYVNNKSKRTNIREDIKQIILRDFEVKGDNLVLHKRDDKQVVVVPFIGLETNPEFLDWIDDSKLFINKNKLNQPSERHTIGTYTTDLIPYNKLIGDFVSMSIEDGQYLTNVQMLVKDVDVTKQPVPKKEDISEEVVADHTITLNEEEDPGTEVIEKEVQNIPTTPITITAIKKDTSSKRNRQQNSKKLTDGRGSRVDKLSEQVKDNKDKDIRAREIENINAPKWNKSEELSWMNKNFPGVDTSVLENLQEIIANGKEYWGVFHNAAIYVAENAASGTLYHEAFHALFNLYTTPKQKEALLKEASKRYKIKLSDEIALEEAMADDFMNYVQTDIEDKSWGKQIANFFKRLQQVIKSLWKNPVYSIDELFWRGNNGFYNNPKITPGEFSDPITRYRVKDWTFRQEKEAVAAVNGYLMTEIIPEQRRLNPNFINLTDVEIINEVGLDNLYKIILDDLDTLSDSEDLTEEESANIIELINNFYDYNNNKFLELHTGLLRGLEFYDIKVNFDTQETSKIGQYDGEDTQEDVLKEAEEKAEDKKENWQDSATERSTKDNALQEVKVFIRNMNSGYKNIFGLDSLVDYQETYDTLLKNLAGTTHVEDMVAFLEKNKVLYPEYQQILDKFDIDPAFKTKFFSAFNKNHTKYNIISYINGNWAVYQANKKGLTNTIMSQWTENILNNKNIIQIDKKGIATVNPEVKKVVENIRIEIKNVLDNWSKDKTEDYYKPLSEAINKLGVTIEPKVLQYIGATKKADLNKFFNTGRGNFNFILSKFDSLKNPFDAEGGLEVGESEAIKNAANWVSKASPELYESSFRNLGGKTVYAHLEQNFLTKLAHRLQDPDRKKPLLEFYNKDQLFYTVDSEGEKVFTNRILKNIEADKGIFDIMVTEGLTDDRGNKMPYRSLDSTGLKLYTIHNYFNNNNKTEAWYRGPVLSDAPNGITFKHTKNKKVDVLNSLVDLAGAEYNRIKTIQEQLGKLSDSEKIENYHIPENANTDSGYHIIQGMRGNKFNPSKYRDKTSKVIESWLTKKADAYFDSMKESGIIVVKDNKIDTENSRLDNRLSNLYNTEESLRDYIREFYFNDFLARAEFSLVTVGDPTFYKSSKSGNNKTIDFVKRAKEIYSPKSILDIEAVYIDPKTKEEIKVGGDYRTIYLSDNEIASPSYNAIKETINSLVKNKIISIQKGKEIITSYSKVNQTDAQAYITLPFYRKTMVGMGKWTNKHQEAYKRLEKGLGTGEDIAIMMQPLKPFAYGQIFADRIGRIVPVQNKNSEYLLLPQLIKDNSQLENLYKFMVGAKVDSINFDSAVKVGLNQVIPNKVFKTKEATEDFIKNTMKESTKDWIHILNMEDRGIQQEVPEHFVDAENLFGTQIRKLIISDLFEGTTYLDGKSDKELRKLYEDILIADLEEAYNEIADQIRDKKTGDINYKQVYDLLLDESRKRGKGEEFEKAIQYDGKNNRLVLPLYNPITSRSAQNLITSIFKSRITKQKIAGGAFVQVSSFGLSEELKLVFNKDKGLEYAEVMLPAWSRKFFKDFIQPNGDIDFNAINTQAPELMDMIGYRIPTEDKYSMLPLRVTGFLPYTAGGAIMLPADITKISGSDFDVDKMYVMMKTFKPSKFNKKQFKKDIKVFSKDNEEFKDVDLSNNNLDIVIDQIFAGQELKDNDLPIFDYYTENRDKYGEAKYRIDEYDSSKSPRENSKNARDNHKIDIMMSILRNPNTVESIMSGGTFVPLQKIAEITSIKLGKKDRGLDTMSIDSMDTMHIDNMAGKSMVGIAANENAFHAIAQHTKLELKTPISFDGENHYSLHETEAKTYFDLDKLVPVKGVKQRISKNKAYYLAAIVDNAKDPVAGYINYNTYTSGIVGLLTQVGLDPATVTWFLKQPVVQDITDRFFASGEDYSKESNIINEYKEKFGIKEDPKIAPNLDTITLYDNLSRNTTHKSQVDVFNAFLVYKKLARDWTALVLASRADTKGFGPTLADSENILDSIDKVIDKDFGISNTKDLFDIESEGTKLVATFTDFGIKNPLEIVNEMFPYAKETGFYREIKKRFSVNLKNRDLSVQERNNINDQITTYLLSKFTAFNPNDRKYYLNEFPKEFLEFSEKNSIFANNYLVRRLLYQSNKSDKKVPIERIVFNNTGALTNELKNDIQKGWLDLYESTEFRNMAEKLFKYSYFTTGMIFGVNGFSHLMPVDMLTDKGVKDNYNSTISNFMYDILDTNVADASDIDEFTNQYYRNNYKNKSFVPMVNEDGTNVRKSHKNDGGSIIGFTVDPKVKDTSLIIGEETQSDGSKRIMYFPFISYKKNDIIYLYQNVTKDSDIAVYVLTNKLGFPNYTYEYMRGAFGLKSSYDFNNPKEYSVTDFVKEKPKESNIYTVEEMVDIEGKNIKINTYTVDPGNSYTITFEYNKKSFTIEKTLDGKYINKKDNKPVSDTSAIVKLFRKATEIIGNKNCGYGA